MRDAIGILLAGGQGERLWPLTRDRAKPAVPFGGVYRIIDVTLSNCINSDLRRVFVLTQYKALSLNRHVRQGWSSLMGLGEFIEILAPQMRVSTNWYLGTADAVYQNIYSIGSERSNYAFVLSGDHIYKMDYGKMLQQHVDTGADVTVATIEIDAVEAAGRFGVIETDAELARPGLRGKTRRAQAFPPASGQSERLDGRLHLQYPAPDPHPDRRRRKSAVHPRFRTRHPAADPLEISRVRLQFRGSQQPGPALLARRRHGRRLLRREHGPGVRLARSSISTTGTGPCAPGSSNGRPRNSSLPIPTAWARPWIPSSAAARSSPAAA